MLHVQNRNSDLFAPLDGPRQHVGIAVEPVDLSLQDPELDLVIVRVGPASEEQHQLPHHANERNRKLSHQGRGEHINEIV